MLASTRTSHYGFYALIRLTNFATNDLNVHHIHATLMHWASLYAISQGNQELGKRIETSASHAFKPTTSNKLESRLITEDEK